MKTTKLTKKIVALVLSLIMMFCTAAPAVAAANTTVQSAQLAEIRSINIVERIRHQIHRIIAYIFIRFGRGCPFCGYDCLNFFPRDIAQTYAEAINTAKEYKGTLTVKKTRDTQITITDAPSAVMSVLQQLITDFVGETEETFTFVDGVTADGVKLTDVVPPKGKEADFYFSMEYSYSLTGDDSSEIGIGLATEEAVFDGTQMVTQAEMNAEVINVIDLAELDTDPMEITAATISYQGTEAVVFLDADGRVTELKTDIPMIISLTCKVGSIGVTTNITVDSSTTYEFIY